MQVTTLKRVFVYNGMHLPDPGAELSPAAVKDFYVTLYPELTNAEVTSAKENGDTIEHTFRKTTGTKGRRTDQEDLSVPFAVRLQAAAAKEMVSGKVSKADLATLASSLFRALNCRGEALVMPSQASPLLL